MSSRIAKARSKKKLFSGLSFKKSFKAKVEATPAPEDQQELHVHAVDTSGGGETAAAGEAPAPKQPFVVVSGMASLSGDVPPATAEDCDGLAQADGAGAPEMTAEDDRSAEAEKHAGETATKAPDSLLSAAAHAVDFEPVAGEVIRVGLAGGSSSPRDDSAAGVADSGSPPAKAAGVAKPVPGDLEAGVTAKTSDGVARSPDTSSRGGEKASEGKLGTKESANKAASGANAATKPAPSGKNRHVVVSGYEHDTSGNYTSVAPAGEVNTRHETTADGVFGKDSDTPPPLEVRKPKKGLFGGLFGSSKGSLKIPDTESDYFAQSAGPGDGTASNVRGSPPVSTDDDGFQPASDLSVDMGDHVQLSSSGVSEGVSSAKLGTPSEQVAGLTGSRPMSPGTEKKTPPVGKETALDPRRQRQLPVLYGVETD